MYACGICTCIWRYRCLCIHTCGVQVLTSSVHLFLHLMFWNRVSRWTWSSTVSLRLASKYLGSGYLCRPSTGVADVTAALMFVLQTFTCFHNKTGCKMVIGREKDSYLNEPCECWVVKWYQRESLPRTKQRRLKKIFMNTVLSRKLYPTKPVLNTPPHVSSATALPYVYHVCHSLLLLVFVKLFFCLIYSEDREDNLLFSSLCPLWTAPVNSPLIIAFKPS